MQSAVDPQPTAKQQNTSLLARAEEKGDANADEWKLAKARTSRRKRLFPKPEMPLQKDFTSLQTEEQRPIRRDNGAEKDSPICSPYKKQCN